MSHRVASAHLFAGSHVVSRWGGLGIPGAEIPTTGDNFGSPLADDDTLTGAEYRLVVVTPPSAGTLVFYPDTSFEFLGAVDGSYSLTYQAWENGVSYGSATDTLAVGVVNANAPGGTGTGTSVGSGGSAVGITVGSGDALGGTGTSTGSGSGGAAYGGSTGSMTLTTADINAIVSALQAAMLPVNIKQVNDSPIKGDGSLLNPWNPL